ncbi:MAG: hypothetical protein ACREA0_08800, partial [bacterium]
MPEERGYFPKRELARGAPLDVLPVASYFQPFPAAFPSSTPRHCMATQTRPVTPPVTPEFKPYVPPTQSPAELTIRAVVL